MSSEVVEIEYDEEDRFEEVCESEIASGTEKWLENRKRCGLWKVVRGLEGLTKMVHYIDCWREVDEIDWAK